MLAVLSKMRPFDALRIWGTSKNFGQKNFGLNFRSLKPHTSYAEKIRTISEKLIVLLEGLPLTWGYVGMQRCDMYFFGM